MSTGALTSGYDDSKEGRVLADGTLTLTIAPTQSYMTWIIGQITVEMPTAPLGATCELRKLGALVTPLIPTADAAGGDPPVVLRAGESLTVKWTGCTTGDLGRVYWMYDQIDPRKLA
jgi:hypothetical protein